MSLPLTVLEILFQRLRMLGKSPRREEIIVIQYDDGVFILDHITYQYLPH